VLLAAIFATVVEVSAKGPTVRLLITGGGLPEPIAIIDATVLSASNVFGDAFLGSLTSEKAINPSWPRYVVSFFVEPPAWMQLGVREMYVVHYVKHPQTGEGFVYLPGAGEEWYRLNVRTIERNGLEGNWLHASPVWASALNAVLP
jgi:hypothetical protein